MRLVVRDALVKLEVVRVVRVDLVPRFIEIKRVTIRPRFDRVSATGANQTYALRHDDFSELSTGP